MVVEFLEELDHALAVDEGEVLDELGLEFLDVGFEVLVEIDCELVEDGESSVEQREDLLSVVPYVALILDLPDVVQHGHSTADIKRHLGLEKWLGDVSGSKSHLQGVHRSYVP